MPETEGIAACSVNGCPHRASMGIRLHKGKERLWASIDFDELTAPKSAVLYCLKHGRETMGSMIITLLPPDEVVPG